jgi:hypothetical protein
VSCVIRLRMVHMRRAGAGLLIAVNGGAPRGD